MKLGLIVNPIAGLGGRTGLKGSDGEAAARALMLGGTPESPARAETALRELLPVKDKLEFLACPGAMGGDELSACGFSYAPLFTPGEATTANDTETAARLMYERGAALILFAGGDGTARNIYTAIGGALPVIGIPAGVKIHSGVYAVNPRNAGLAALEFVCGKANGLTECEVMDIDEELFRQGRVSAKLYGYMNVPGVEGHMQNSKSEGSSDAESLLGMAEGVAAELEPDTLYIIGPGSTTRAVMDELGLQNTLLGVDAIRHGALVASDLSEKELWALISDPYVKAKAILTIIGGQGNLFGRGNQQLSPRILRRLGKQNIIVCSTRQKLRGLDSRPLVVDTGDPELDHALAGYVDIVVDYGQTVFYKVTD